MALEKIVLDEGRTDTDRIGAGFYLTLVYGRLRYSDAQQVSHLALDMPNARQGFLEGVAGRTKTSVSLERKCRFLPIAIPTLSLSDRPWVSSLDGTERKTFWGCKRRRKNAAASKPCGWQHLVENASWSECWQPMASSIAEWSCTQLQRAHRDP